MGLYRPPWISGRTPSPPRPLTNVHFIQLKQEVEVVKKRKIYPPPLNKTVKGGHISYLSTIFPCSL